MSTYNELASMVLDIAKVISDDSHITKDHVMFLLSKYRGYILNQQYASLKKTVNGANYQTICLDLEDANPDFSFCGQVPMLRSTVKVPNTMTFSKVSVYPTAGFNYGRFIATNYDRFKYAGSSKFLHNEIYTTIGPDKYIYIKSSNNGFKYLDRIIVTAVFNDPEKAAMLECDANGTKSNCRLLDKEFPLEDNFHAALIQMVVKDVLNASYNTADINNDAHDDLSDLGNLIQRYTNQAFKNLAKSKTKDDE